MKFCELGPWLLTINMSIGRGVNQCMAIRSKVIAPHVDNKTLNDIFLIK
jgi:hypothetical protein